MSGWSSKGTGVVALASVFLAAGFVMTRLRRAEEDAPPRIDFAVTEHDLGAVDDETPSRVSFHFSNGGASPLRLSGLATGCSCTSARQRRDTLAPGESGEIDVTFDPRGRKGYLSNHILVSSNDPARPAVTLTLRANVVPRLDVEPTLFRLGTVRSGEEKALKITLRAADPKAPVTVDQVTASNPSARVRLLDVSSAHEGGAVATILLCFEQAARAEPVQTDLWIRAAMPSTRWASARVFATFAASFEVFPTMLYVSQDQPATAFTARVKIAGAIPFQLKKVTLGGAEGLAAQVAAEAATGPAASHTLTLTGTTPRAGGGFRGLIIVESDIPDAGTIRVPFQGFVRAAP